MQSLKEELDKISQALKVEELPEGRAQMSIPNHSQSSHHQE